MRHSDLKPLQFARSEEWVFLDPLGQKAFSRGELQHIHGAGLKIARGILSQFQFTNGEACAF